jgi:hypothetical protein
MVVLTFVAAAPSSLPIGAEGAAATAAQRLVATVRARTIRDARLANGFSRTAMTSPSGKGDAGLVRCARKLYAARTRVCLFCFYNALRWSLVASLIKN